MDFYGKCIEIDSMSALGYFGRAKFLFEGKKAKYKEALGEVEKAVGRDGHWAAPWCLKGDVLQAMNKYGEAIVAYEKA